jgi:AcrR family transcriptional regulator
VAHVSTEVRRQQFMEAAIAVIAREGVDGATTRRIADEAGAPLATLHYCFQNKENLLWATFERLAEMVRRDVDSGTAQSLQTRVTHLFRAAVRWGLDNPVPNRAQIEILLWAARNDQAFAEKVYSMFVDSWKEQLSQARPSLPDEELDSLVRVVVALLDGLCMQVITHGDDKRILREAETAEALLAAYLGRRARR